MERDKAIQILVQRSTLFKKLLYRLTAWDEALTVGENAKAMGMSLHVARRISGRYDLKFRRGNRSINGYTFRKSMKSRSRYVRRWDPRLSIRANAKVFGITPNVMYYHVQRYNLPIKYVGEGKSGNYRSERVDAMRKQFKVLRASGLTHQKIADMYGITRQRVHQLCL